MSFITWTNANAINITLIDEQHQQLFELLNRLHASVVGGLEQHEIHSILDDLIQYTVYHFEAEENLHADHKYPQREEHKEEHDKLTKEVLKLQGELRDGSATISFEILDFLHGWLKDHTTGSDMEFGDYVHANNISIE